MTGNGLKPKLTKLPKLDTTDYRDDGSSHIGGDKLWKRVWRHTREDWYETVTKYQANPDSFYNSWWYLNNHPAFWRLAEKPREGFPLLHMVNVDTNNAFIDGTIWISVQRVNPETGKRSHDEFLNTRQEIWLECGEWAWETQEKYHIDYHTHYHNWKLDCGGATYEEAVIKMARNVWKFYGNDRRKCAPGYEQKKREKINAKADSGKRRFRIVENNTYGHMCRHSFAPGWRGDIERSMAEMKEHGKE